MSSASTVLAPSGFRPIDVSGNLSAETRYGDPSSETFLEPRPPFRNVRDGNSVIKGPFVGGALRFNYPQPSPNCFN